MIPSASRPHTILWILLLAATALLLQGVGCGRDEARGVSAAPERGALDAASLAAADAPITAANVYHHEADWPTAVKLTGAWTPSDGGDPVPSNARGVLVRVNPDGNPRVDFGRHGKHDVPAEATDLVERANRVHAGTEYKNRPNFLRQIGNRTVHPTAEPMRAMKSAELAGRGAYLCVFADPTSDVFPEIARRLVRATADHDVLFVLFPEALGREDVPVVRKRLAEIEWPVPFMYPHLVEDYRQALLGDDVGIPALLVVTANGRVLYRSRLDESLDEAALGKALASDRTVS
jgi:hypothetical protein